MIACRIMLLGLLGREAPGLPAELVFDACECEVLQDLGSKKLSMGEAVIIIARLGGYLNRRCDGPPSLECLGRGYIKFETMVFITRLRRTAASKPS